MSAKLRGMRGNPAWTATEYAPIRYGNGKTHAVWISMHGFEEPACGIHRGDDWRRAPHVTCKHCIRVIRKQIRGYQSLLPPEGNVHE